MKAIFQSKALQEVLRLVAGITSGPQYVNLKADKQGTLYVLASGNDAVIQMVVADSKVFEAGEVTVNLSTLSGLIKNSTELEISASNKKESKVVLSSVKGRKYTADFTSPPFNPIKVIPSDTKGKSIKFSKAVQAFLEEAIQRIGLSNVYTDDPIYIWVKSGDSGGTSMACGDQFHFAHYHHAEVNLGKKEFSLPLKTIRDIQGIAGKQSYKINLQESQIFASNEFMTLSMPLTQDKEGVGIKQFETLLSSLKKPDAWAVVSKADLSNALDNITAVYEVNVPLTLSMVKNKLKVSFQTSYTTVKETLSVEKEKWASGVEAKCDPALLLDTLACISDKELKLSVLKGKTLFVKVEQPSVAIHYACSVM